MGTAIQLHVDFMQESKEVLEENKLTVETAAETEVSEDMEPKKIPLRNAAVAELVDRGKAHRCAAHVVLQLGGPPRHPVLPPSSARLVFDTHAARAAADEPEHQRSLPDRESTAVR